MTIQIREAGTIKEIKKSIAKVAGLSDCINGQLLEVTPNTKGLVMGFSEGEALVLLLGKTQEANIGSTVFSGLESLRIPVGEGFIGRVVNALAEPADGKGTIAVTRSPVTSHQSPVKALTGDLETGDLETGKSSFEYYPVFREAPGVLDRVPITGTFETGTLVIDAAIPIGKGQRELIIGDRMTGKTAICVDAILNQRGKDVICIYCCIGRSYASLEKITGIVKERGALAYTIIVSASASSSIGEQYLAPYSACALGEYFMDRGKDVFIVFDDLTKHAWAYRQLSLLMERSPGRDAYPGDIFYLHSQLMERAGKLKPELGGGSMTFFPIVDTLQGDITGYIPSNLVSMTDGQIYLNAGLFSSGFRPAIDLGLSVSRIGNKAQPPAMRELSGMLRIEYLQYNELIKVTRFKTGLAEETDRQLRHGEAITRVFIQDKDQPRPLEEELILLYALRSTVLDALSPEETEYFKKKIFGFAKKEFPSLIGKLSEKGGLSIDISRGIEDCLGKFFKEQMRG